MNEKKTKPLCSCCEYEEAHEHDHHHHEHDHHDDEHKHHHCGCGCCEEGEEKTDQKTFLIRCILGAALFAGAFFAPGTVKTLLFLAAYLVFGCDVLYAAGKRILSGKIFDENFLMALATVGAIAIGEYPEAVAVMLFYQLGEFFQDLAVERSEQSVMSLMELRPDWAYIEKNGERVKVAAEEVQIGDILMVAAGERIPLDGIITAGESYLDTACLTGESVPRHAAAGDEVQSGVINRESLLKIRVTKEFKDSTASKILELMEHTSENKTKPERFITAFAKKYTPAVVLLAAVIAVIPPLFDGMQFTKWIYRALDFLVVSCPCALVISVPLSFFAGIGCASKHGIILKSSEALEKISRLDAVVFDKTGTLTEGSFEITGLHTRIPETEFLELCAYAEHYSNHPIAGVIKKACSKTLELSRLSQYTEITGKGVSVLLDGEPLLVGNDALMQEHGMKPEQTDAFGTVLHLAKNQEYLGYIVISDKIRKSSKETVSALKKQGFYTAMLTGDRKSAAEKIGALLGLDEVHSQLLPQDKVAKMEQITKTHRTAFVGDGMNDAPVLAMADVGFAMGGIGSDAAITAADAILMTDDLNRIPDAVSLSKKTLRIVHQNIVFAIAVKVLILILCALGYATMWAAVFADVGVSFLAILNAMRALYQRFGQN